MAEPGSTITIYGHWYTSTCNDTGSDAPLHPLPPVRLTIALPGGVVQELGEFEPAGADMGFSVRVAVPRGAQPGIATVRDDLPDPASYTFRVDRPAPR